MRMSSLLSQTLREAPSDAEILSHQLLVFRLMPVEQHLGGEGAVEGGTPFGRFQRRAPVVEPFQRLVHHRAGDAGFFAQLVARRRMLAQQRQVHFCFVFGKADLVERRL